jgi:fumarate reductase subunit D
MWWLIVVGLVLIGIAMYLILQQLPGLSSYQKRRYALITFFIIGLLCIAIGLYLEAPNIADSVSWIFQGRMGTVFVLLIVLVVMWMGLGRMGTITDKSDSQIVRGMGNLIFGVGILVSLVILGAIIHNIAQGTLEKDMRDRPGEYYPNKPRR